MRILTALLWGGLIWGQGLLPSPIAAGGGGGGSGTVTSIATGCGTSGGTITTTGTIIANEAVNAQTGVTYTYLNGDCGKLVTHSNGSAIAGTLPQANGSTFVAGWFMDVHNRGAGTLTITPTTSTIDGAATYILLTGQGTRIVSDGTNYFTVAPNVVPLGATVTGATAGSVLFTNTGPTLAQDNANLFWDGTNHALGIGTNTPWTYNTGVGGNTSFVNPATLAGSFVGPPESSLAATLQGYTGGTNSMVTMLVTDVNKSVALGVEVDGGMEGSADGIFATAYGTQNGGSYTGVGANGLANGNGVVASGLEAFAQTRGGVPAEIRAVHATVSAFGGAALVQEGILVDDITGGVANWSIRTGLGLLDWGDNEKQNSRTYANRGSAVSGYEWYCSDCQVTSSIDATIASGGTGCPVEGVNSIWVCL